MPASNPEPRESFDPIQKNIVLDYPKSITNNHGYNMQEKDSFENYYIVMDILLDDIIEESKKKSLLQKILHK